MPAREDDYEWGGKPGEDFGPIGPPIQPHRERRPVASDLSAGTARRPADGVPPRAGAAPRRPDGLSAATPPRSGRWRRLTVAFGALAVLLGLGAVAVMAVAPPWPLEALVPAFVAAPAPAASPVPAAPSPAPPAAASPAPPPLGAGGAAPAPSTSPTPLTLGPPTPTPIPARSPAVAAASPAPRQPAAILPTPPSLVTPPGLRFPTSTPARLSTPGLARTPPPIGTPRLPSFSTRVWSEQAMHRSGEVASICGQASSGSNAQLTVIAPDRATRVLGEFTPSAERVCQTLVVDQQGLYVLSIIVKDANGNEIDRQSAALWVSR